MEGFKQAEVVQCVCIMGTGHHKSRFSERAQTMLPNPLQAWLTQHTHTVHAVVLYWHLFMTIGQRCVRGVVVCMADVKDRPGCRVHLRPPSIQCGKLHAMAYWQSFFPVHPGNIDTQHFLFGSAVSSAVSQCVCVCNIQYYSMSGCWACRYLCLLHSSYG